MSTAWRLSAVLLALYLVQLGSLYSQGRRQNRYPNELPRFRFYAKYFAPLRPGVSDRDAVRRVLGDTATVKRSGWSIYTTYMTTGGPVYDPSLGPLAGIIMKPEAVIQMGAVEFPAAFDHCHAGVSELNITFDVYRDTFGLEYWLHEEDSKWGKKGDLFQVVYGPTRRPYPPHSVC